MTYISSPVASVPPALLCVDAMASAPRRWVTKPSACPSGQRFQVEAPHLIFITRAAARVARTHADETVLKGRPRNGLRRRRRRWIGPRHAASGVRPAAGCSTTRCGALAAGSRTSTRQGDARALPYPDATFDAGFLVAVLGEIPDQAAALSGSGACEAGRRLVVGGSPAIHNGDGAGVA